VEPETVELLGSGWGKFLLLHRSFGPVISMGRTSTMQNVNAGCFVGDGYPRSTGAFFGVVYREEKPREVKEVKSAAPLKQGFPLLMLQLLLQLLDTLLTLLHQLLFMLISLGWVVLVQLQTSLLTLAGLALETLGLVPPLFLLLLLSLLGLLAKTLG
jgi:hypothetical protein